MRGMRTSSGEFETSNLRTLAAAEAPTPMARLQQGFFEKSAAIYDGYAYRLTIETRAGQTNESYTSVLAMLAGADIRCREVRRYTIDPDRVCMDLLVRQEDLGVINDLAKEVEKDGITITFNDNISEAIKPRQIVTPEKELNEDLPKGKKASKVITSDSEEEPEEEAEVEEELAEPSEGDYMLSDSGPLGSHTAVSEVGGSHLGDFSSIDAAEAFITKRMKAEQFWPSVWYVSDHGNVEPYIIENK